MTVMSAIVAVARTRPLYDPGASLVDGVDEAR
jgi:hypothetical protein